tara:strand:- start:48609 stop:48758 length:150 start_codon:yes stop_codon:yes gene_type:complete
MNSSKIYLKSIDKNGYSALKPNINNGNIEIIDFFKNQFIIPRGIIRCWT